jgi:hypothetical protein
MSNLIPTLSAVTVFEGNGSVLVRYDLSRPVPSDNVFMVGVRGKSRDGEVPRQFGIKFMDGDSTGYFVFDHNAVKQENFDYIAATEDPRQILTPYPSGPFGELGDMPQLRGYLNYAGVDQQTDVPVEVVS